MLPRKNRISRKDFPSHNVKGFRVFSPFFTAVFYKNNENLRKMAVVVSKKTAKTAVLRNFLRRRFYSLAEGSLKSTPIPLAVVIYPKIEAKSVKSEILKNEIETLFDNASKAIK